MNFIKRNKKNINVRWISIITTLAFVITLLFSMGSDAILRSVNPILSIVIILFFIALGVLFDMIGVAVTSAEEKPFHSMSAKKMHGSKLAYRMIKHADKVSSFCADVIGDICSIMSGSAGIVLATSISEKYNIDILVTTLIITALIAATMVGGKAIGKSLAINKSETIVHEFAKICSIFYK